MLPTWIIPLLLIVLVLFENIESTRAGTGGQRRQLPKNRRRKQDEFEEPPRSWEYKIKKKLTKNYDKTSRPVKNDTTTIKVNIAMSLFHILDTNEKHQTFSALVSIRLRWMDEYMVWNKSEFGNISQIHIPAYNIWLPDLVIKNLADDGFSGFPNTLAKVQHTGQTLWMFPAAIKMYCTLDVRHFPFDSQECDIIFLSWTYSGFQVDLVFSDSDPNAIYYSPVNQEWWVDRITTERHIMIYTCCEEPYPDVTLTIHMNRRSLFYIFNLIFPCILIYVVSMLGFFLPIESGEKVNLEINVLLALVVFLMIIGEIMPPTPDAIPLLGKLFSASLIMVTVALIMGVLVTSLHLRRYSKQKVPPWIGQYIIRCECLKEKLKKNKVKLKCKSKARGQKLYIERDIIAGSQEMESLTSLPQKPANGRPSKLNSEANLVSETTFPDTACDTASQDPSNKDDEHGESSSQTKPPTLCPCKSPQAWSKLATYLDRVFFYLFLLGTLLTFYLIFHDIPSFSNEMPRSDGSGNNSVTT